MFRFRCPQPHPTPPRTARSLRSERAQSTIEFVATLPLLVLAATLCLQALLCGFAVICAQAAADRAARGTPSTQALERVPSGWRDRARITSSARSATVTIAPPALLPGTSRLLHVRATSLMVSP